jgi:molybdate transport system permease protein
MTSSFTAPPTPRPVARNVRRKPRAPTPLLVLGGLGAALFGLPFIGLIVACPWRHFVPLLRSQWPALWLSGLTTAVTTALCVTVGVALAWLQVRVEFPGRPLLRAITTVPVVLPPVVGGMALLLILGRKGWIGGPLYELTGWQLSYTTAGAVLAETFVAMPFLVMTVAGALQTMDRRSEDAARSLGASPWRVFWFITLPEIRPSVIAGAVLCWARALGEFGATITFAGNLPGATQTLPLAVYQAMETDLDGAISLSVALFAVSLGVLFAMRNSLLGAP